MAGTGNRRNDRRPQRHSEAVLRQEAHDTLSTAEWLEKARSRRGNSKREITRLNKEHTG
jgi:hypothetical protein